MPGTVHQEAGKTRCCIRIYSTVGFMLLLVTAILVSGLTIPVTAQEDEGWEVFIVSKDNETDAMLYASVVREESNYDPEIAQFGNAFRLIIADLPTSAEAEEVAAEMRQLGFTQARAVVGMLAQQHMSAMEAVQATPRPAPQQPASTPAASPSPQPTGQQLPVATTPPQSTPAVSSAAIPEPSPEPTTAGETPLIAMSNEDSMQDANQNAWEDQPLTVPTSSQQSQAQPQTQPQQQAIPTTQSAVQPAVQPSAQPVSQPTTAPQTQADPETPLSSPLFDTPISHRDTAANQANAAPIAVPVQEEKEEPVITPPPVVQPVAQKQQEKPEPEPVVKKTPEPTPAPATNRNDDQGPPIKWVRVTDHGEVEVPRGHAELNPAPPERSVSSTAPAPTSAPVATRKPQPVTSPDRHLPPPTPDEELAWRIQIMALFQSPYETAVQEAKQAERDLGVPVRVKVTAGGALLLQVGKYRSEADAMRALPIVKQLGYKDSYLIHTR